MCGWVGYLASGLEKKEAWIISKSITEFNHIKEKMHKFWNVTNPICNHT